MKISKAVSEYLFLAIVVALPSLLAAPASAAIWDCFWGGANEETSYTPPYVRGAGNVTLAQVTRPDINLGAPQPGGGGVPVQATPGNYAINVPQATIPTINVPTGPVGSVGMPATPPFAASTSAAQQPGVNAQTPLPPGTEIMYVLPPEKMAEAVCLDGTPSTPAQVAKVVAPGTPGAIPVAVRSVTVRRPKVERRLSYSPIKTKTETLVNVVDRRTGRVVRTYCDNDETQSTLPWPHLQETVTYETVTVKVATPLSLAPAASTSRNSVIHDASSATAHQSRYPAWEQSAEMLGVPSAEGASQQTMIGY